MPNTQVILTRARPDSTLALSAGEQRDLLRTLDGAMVAVFGVLTREMDLLARPRGAPIFQLSSFCVRAVNGVQAQDGVLEREGDAFWLRTRDGARLPIHSLPSALRDEVGSRVFLVGSLSEAVVGYGLISKAP